MRKEWLAEGKEEVGKSRSSLLDRKRLLQFSGRGIGNAMSVNKTRFRTRTLRVIWPIWHRKTRSFGS